MSKNTGAVSSKFPDATTFASLFGLAVWLMTVSKRHREMAIKDIEQLLTPAVVLQQIKIYQKGTQPIAFVSWAAVSDDILERFEAGDRRLETHEWRSGRNVIVVECVSPFADEKDIIAQFMDSVKSGPGAKG